MKRILLLILFFAGFGSTFAQAPQITGDLMLCPDTSGTASIVNNQAYDTYQWYYKFWFTSDDYEAIPGATGPSFTYDWYNYDQSLFKVVVTLGGQTYESNIIQIDSYAWAGFDVGTELNDSVTINPENGNLLLCNGGSFTASIFMPYDSGIQWYKDGEPITGATAMDYVISGPGSYHVVAAPSFCPHSTSSNEFLPIVVEVNPDCDLGTHNPNLDAAIKIHPNPATEILVLDLPHTASFTSYRIVDASGKVLVENPLISGQNSTAINVSDLSAGFYFLQLQGDNQHAVKRFIKN